MLQKYKDYRIITTFAFHHFNLKIMLPKFLLADNSQESQDTIYIVHTEKPRFITESDIEDFWSNQKIHWIDQKPKSEKEIEDLLQAAESFLEDELDNEDELDEENDLD